MWERPQIAAPRRHRRAIHAQHERVVARALGLGSGRHLSRRGVIDGDQRREPESR